MKKIVFLILHYYTCEDTIKCVESIEKLNYKKVEIVIVDNASKNGTGKELEEIYKNNKKIHIILSEQNLGFANGNNLGFEYAKKNLNPDYIVMCNNDVYMIQEDFCERIIEEERQSNFAVLGPKILLPDNKVCNYSESMPTLKELQITKINHQIYYYLNKLNLRYIYTFLFKYINKKFTKVCTDYNSRKENVLINGCCIIFSKVYIDKFDGLDDRTFLYYEEQLLYLRIKENNMKSVYNPNIEIFHNEGVSTNKSQKNKRKKIDFIVKYEIESLKILISEMKKLG